MYRENGPRESVRLQPLETVLGVCHLEFWAAVRFAVRVLVKHFGRMIGYMGIEHWDGVHCMMTWQD